MLFAVAMLPSTIAIGGQVIYAHIINHTGPAPQQCRAGASLDGDRIRIDIPPPAGKPDTVMYLPDQNVLRHLDAHSKRFMEFDTRLLDSASGAARSLREVFDQAMAGLKKQPDTSRTDVDIQAENRIETVSGLRCRKFVVKKNGIKIQEVWATSWRNTGLNRRQIASLKQLALYYENLATALAGIPLFDDMQQVPLGALVRIDAYPVLIKQYYGRRLAFAIRLDAPCPKAVAASAYQIPANYKRQRPWQQGP